jgi:hypothetical protein
MQKLVCEEPVSGLLTLSNESISRILHLSSWVGGAEARRNWILVAALVLLCTGALELPANPVSQGSSLIL